MKVGILEFRDNDFIRSVVEGLRGIECEFIHFNQIVHPSPSPYPVIVDRASFCDPFLGAAMRYWALDGAYVLNDPCFTLVSNKLSDVLWCDRLGIRHPRTVLLPRANREEDIRELASEPDWDALGGLLGFPMILKPVDGYAWQDVFRVENPASLRGLYETLKDSRTLIAQELVDFVRYYRVFCINRREAYIVKWNPRPFDMGEYSIAGREEIQDIGELVTTKTIELNAAFGLDFNSVEWCVTRDGTPMVIDAHNDVPDVRREKIPPSCYEWIVSRFCACVREKVAAAESSPSDAGASAR